MSAYVMRISDWSSDVCSSDLTPFGAGSSQTPLLSGRRARQIVVGHALGDETVQAFEEAGLQGDPPPRLIDDDTLLRFGSGQKLADVRARSRKAEAAPGQRGANGRAPPGPHRLGNFAHTKQSCTTSERDTG